MATTEHLNTVAIVALGALLGAIGTLPLLFLGIYPLMRKLLSAMWRWESRPWSEELMSIMELAGDYLQWISELEDEDMPRSRPIATITLVGLFCLLVLTIWLSPLKMKWVPFIAAYCIGAAGTMGLFEISYRRALRSTPPDEKAQTKRLGSS